MRRPTCVYYDRRNRDACTECGNPPDLCLCQDPNEIAHKRLTSDEGRFLRVVYNQVQDLKSQNHLFEELIHEVGELGISLVAHDATRSPSSDVITKNLSRIAALATRLAVSGTDEYSYPTT